MRTYLVCLDTKDYGMKSVIYPRLITDDENEARTAAENFMKDVLNTEHKFAEFEISEINEITISVTEKGIFRTPNLLVGWLVDKDRFVKYADTIDGVLRAIDYDGDGNEVPVGKIIELINED